MEEAEVADLSSYPSLGQLFRRRLRPGCRPLAPAPLVAPADGALLTCGRLQQGDRVEQVKGVTYSLRAFLGEGWGRGVAVAGPAPAPMVLHQAVVYLAPGDYHCFHAPADWTVTQRRHFPGRGFVYPATGICFSCHLDLFPFSNLFVQSSSSLFQATSCLCLPLWPEDCQTCSP